MLGFLILFSFQLYASEIEVSLENLRSQKGEVLYLLFAAEKGFPDQAGNSLIKGSIPAREAHERGIMINGLVDGEYALSIFHDENSNHKLDTTFIGIPKEGFGFSQNPYVFFGPPSFNKAKFVLKTRTKLKVKILYF